MELKALLKEWSVTVDCERVTLWMIDAESGAMFNILSTSLGNSMIVVPLGQGLAGRAAETGQDVDVQDAYTDPDFLKDIDVKTGFRTRQVCCVVLRKPGQEEPYVEIAVGIDHSTSARLTYGGGHFF